MASYVALLRGINVGGHNVIPMIDLRACFEDEGHESVRTYIQSGNVVFRSSSRSANALAASLEAALSTRFGYEAQVVVLAHARYRSALDAAPAWWGKGDDRKHQALFTVRSTTPAKALRAAPPPREGVDDVATAPGVIFWSVSKEAFGRSAITKFGASAAYRDVTVRNANTARKLLELLEAM